MNLRGTTQVSDIVPGDYICLDNKNRRVGSSYLAHEASTLLYCSIKRNETLLCVYKGDEFGYFLRNEGIVELFLHEIDTFFKIINEQATPHQNVLDR